MSKKNHHLYDTHFTVFIYYVIILYNTVTQTTIHYIVSRQQNNLLYLKYKNCDKLNSIKTMICHKNIKYYNINLYYKQPLNLMKHDVVDCCIFIFSAA